MTARVPCAHCSAPARRVTRGMAFCAGCMAEAERIFRRTHSPLDADWIPARNRFFGKPEVMLAALRAEAALASLTGESREMAGAR